MLAHRVIVFLGCNNTEIINKPITTNVVKKDVMEQTVAEENEAEVSAIQHQRTLAVDHGNLKGFPECEVITATALLYK